MNIHLGWHNETNGEQLAPQAQYEGITLAQAMEKVDALNLIEERRDELPLPPAYDRWFVMVGDAMCAQGKCSVCADDLTLHHWEYATVDDEDLEGDEDEEVSLADDILIGGRMGCRHCLAWRTMTDLDE